MPKGTSQYQLLEELGQQWRNDSAGAVKLIIHGGATMGDEAEMVTKIRTKQLNAGLFTSFGLAEIDPAATGLMLVPLMYRSWAEVDYVREKMRAQIESRFRAKGFEVLFWADAGWVRFFSKRPGLQPADYRPMKIFVWEGDEPQIAIMRSIGFRAVPLVTSNLTLGLTTNLIDAAPMPPFLALASQVYTPAPHMLDLAWCPIVGAAVVSTAVWGKIPAALRTQLAASGLPIGEKIRTRGRADDLASVQAMQQHGLTVHTVSPAAAAEWQNLAVALYPKIRGNTVPAETFDAITQHLRDFRAAAASTP